MKSIRQLGVALAVGVLALVGYSQHSQAAAGVFVLQPAWLPIAAGEFDR